MGYSTDIIGHIEIRPPLNIAEQHYLLAFSEGRRFDRPGGRYDVPGDPSAEHCEDPADLDAYNTLAVGQPSSWCDWQPCWDGSGLAYNGREKFYGATSWLAYLIDHFLAPHAHAAATGLACFAGFTFDHVLDGVVAACRRDTRELYLIQAERNVVREKSLHQPGTRYLDADPLSYEIAIDASRDRRFRRT